MTPVRPVFPDGCAFQVSFDGLLERFFFLFAGFIISHLFVKPGKCPVNIEVPCLIAFKGTVKILLGICKFFGVAIGVAQIDFRSGKFRFEFDCRFIIPDGLIEFLGAWKGQAHVAVEIVEVIWRQAVRLKLWNLYDIVFNHFLLSFNALRRIVQANDSWVGVVVEEIDIDTIFIPFFSCLGISFIQESVPHTDIIVNVVGTHRHGRKKMIFGFFIFTDARVILPEASFCSRIFRTYVFCFFKKRDGVMVVWLPEELYFSGDNL